MIGEYIRHVGGASAMRYFHGDHLGSVSAVTDDSGALNEQDAFDDWGKRRNLNGTGDPADSLTSWWTRGYTGQEHLPDVALIHMNGRVYDPQIGKFTSGDPLVSQPYSTQGWNRYAYVGNNPLNSTDPSGMEPRGDDGGGDSGTNSGSDSGGNSGSDSGGNSGSDASSVGSTQTEIDVYGITHCIPWPICQFSGNASPRENTGGGRGGPENRAKQKSQSKGRENCGNGSQILTGSNELSISFDSPNINQPVNPQLAAIVDSLGNVAGVNSINVSSTTGGHGPTDPHTLGNAVDINQINGVHVGNPGVSSLAAAIQNYAMSFSQTYASFGPSGIYMMQNTGQFSDVTNQYPALANEHSNHLHIGVGC